jgi:threonine dehydrogenase-like Zn-dependent dehydrogenase
MKDRIFSIRYWMVVSLPFNISCGFCKDCEAGLTAYCLTGYPGMPGAVKHYNRHLLNLIHAGRAKPSWIISRRLPLARLPTLTSILTRDNEWTEVVLRPAVRYAKLARKWGAKHRSLFSFWIYAGDRLGTTVFRSHST